MMGYPQDCDLIYSSASQDVRSFYNARAEHYNVFLEETNYVLSNLVVQEILEHYQDAAAYVADIGCGTGKLGVALKAARRGMTIHGIDFSNSMLDIASATGVYEKLHSVDVKTNLFEITNKYDLLISSGAFTPGHLDDTDLVNLIDLLGTNGRAFVSVKKDHFDDAGFEATLNTAVSNGLISGLGFNEVQIWDHPDYTDTAIIVRFIKE